MTTCRKYRTLKKGKNLVFKSWFLEDSVLDNETPHLNIIATIWHVLAEPSTFETFYPCKVQ